MNTAILQHFSTTVADYDTVADYVVLRNEELHDELIAALDFDKAKPIKVLDLGCGTGHGLSLLLKKFPKSEVIGVDFSPRMIQKCQSHLQPFRGRFELIERDFTDMELGGPYDAIISAVAIHNCTHQEKLDLFSRIYNALSFGGIFANGDFIEGETDFLENQAKELYKNFVKTNLRGDELEAWLRHIEVDDKPMKLSLHFEALSKLGFKSFGTRWLFANEAVYSALKPLQ